MNRMHERKLHILFLCTGNSCRSQMAEGWARHLLSGSVNAYSAGISAQGLNPRAVEAMSRFGLDISNQRSKSVEEFEGTVFDYVFTVCDNARSDCPAFGGEAIKIHHAFDDPPKLAEHASNDREAMNHYIRVCREIGEWIESLAEMPWDDEASRVAVNQ